MEILRKITLIFMALLFSFLATAQTEKILEAFEKSLELENNGKYSAAIEQIKSVYSENSYEINLRLGWLSYQNGDFRQSQAYYQKSISLMPYSIEPRFGIAYPASALGNWNLIVLQYKKILEIDPQNVTAHYRLGMIYYNRKDYETAFPHFEKAVNLYPLTSDALIMLAWTNFQLGKSREAKILFQKVLMLDPDNASATQGLEALN